MGWRRVGRLHRVSTADRLHRSARMVRLTSVVASALVVLLLALSGCSAGASTTGGTTSLQTLPKLTGTLKPGEFLWGEDATGGAPYVFQDPEKLSSDIGFEVDIANAMAKLLGVKQQWVQINWSDWPQDLAANQFDFFMNGLEISPDNQKDAVFSIPYYVYTEEIVVRADTNASNIHSLTDLENKTVGTGTGYKAQEYLQADPKIATRTYDSVDTMFNDLASGTLDALLLDAPIAQWYGANDSQGRFKVVTNPDGSYLDLFPGYYGLGFNPKNPHTPQLLSLFNQVIRELLANGTLENIYKQWHLWNSAQKCLSSQAANCPPVPKNP